MTEKILDLLLFVTATAALILLSSPLWASATIFPLGDGVVVIVEPGEPTRACITLEDGIVVCQ